MKSIQKKIKSEFNAALKEQLNHIDFPVKLCCALSGGADSTALLLLLKEYAQESSCSLEAVYINHGIRHSDEMEAEEAHIRSLCTSQNIPLFVKTFSQGFLENYARKKGCGVESAARSYRYHVFEKYRFASETPVYFALGHNRNDQTETVLMRLFSGSTPEGLRGIPETRDFYFRPLINTTRSDIEAYLAELGVHAVQDSTNGQCDYLRNRTRNLVLPAIRESFPACEEGILGFRNDLSAILDHYSELLKEHVPWSGSPGEGTFSCSWDNFIKLPFVSRKSAVLEKINLLQKGKGSGRRIPSSFLTPLLSMKGKVLLKGYGIVLERRGSELHLSRDRSVFPETFFRIDRSHDFCYYPQESGVPGATVIRIGLRKGRDIGNNVRILTACGTLSVAGNDSFIVRTPLGKGEAAVFSALRENPEFLVFEGPKLLCTLGKGNFFTPPEGSGKKMEDIISDCYYLCIIIEGRGHYAPGRQKQ